MIDLGESLDDCIFSAVRFLVTDPLFDVDAADIERFNWRCRGCDGGRRRGSGGCSGSGCSSFASPATIGFGFVIFSLPPKCCDVQATYDDEGGAKHGHDDTGSEKEKDKSGSREEIQGAKMDRKEGKGVICLNSLA